MEQDLNLVCDTKRADHLETEESKSLSFSNKFGRSTTCSSKRATSRACLMIKLKKREDTQTVSDAMRGCALLSLIGKDQPSEAKDKKNTVGEGGKDRCNPFALRSILDTASPEGEERLR